MDQIFSHQIKYFQDLDRYREKNIIISANQRQQYTKVKRLDPNCFIEVTMEQAKELNGIEKLIEPVIDTSVYERNRNKENNKKE